MVELFIMKYRFCVNEITTVVLSNGPATEGLQ